MSRSRLPAVAAGPGFGLPTSPSFVVDLDQLRRNGAILKNVQERSGAKIVLALKAFAAWGAFPALQDSLSGVTASGSQESRLGREVFAKEVHTYAPAYSDAEFEECLELSDHLMFNSFSQWERFKDRCLAEASKRPVRFGLRVNPEHSEVKTPLYDPCCPGSRLGIRRESFDGRDLRGITGLHFHTLCELGADALERTLQVVESKWGGIISGLEWVNFGGGHHITRPGYDTDRLVAVIESFRERYNVDVYLEPGEAVALNAGVLVATVLDLIDNNGPIAMLDVSATAHMPDVLEMPYRPLIVGAGAEGEKVYSYTLGGSTCLAGDVIGKYSFDAPLEVGDRLVFEDMAIYSMVKTTFFNGVRHPAIALWEQSTGLAVVREFGYADYKARLG